MFFIYLIFIDVLAALIDFQKYIKISKDCQNLTLILDTCSFYRYVDCICFHSHYCCGDSSIVVLVHACCHS